MSSKKMAMRLVVITREEECIVATWVCTKVFGS